jgi:hypothetical protein
VGSRRRLSATHASRCAGVRLDAISHLAQQHGHLAWLEHRPQVLQQLAGEALEFELLNEVLLVHINTVTRVTSAV